jgi:hypothetical protein
MGTSAGRPRKRVGLANKNGELLQLADSKFDALITIDTNFRYQQNLKQRKMAIRCDSRGFESSCRS